MCIVSELNPPAIYNYGGTTYYATTIVSELNPPAIYNAEGGSISLLIDCI